MDGYETMERLRSDGYAYNGRIIAVTAHAFDHERDRILSAGADDFIRKPFQRAELLDALLTSILKIGTRRDATIR